MALVLRIRGSFPILAAALLLLPAGCTSTRAHGVAPKSVTWAMHGDPARPAHSMRWTRSELYFAIAALDSADDRKTTGANLVAAQAQWHAFLDREVTPRFRDGLTVLDGEGQWLPSGQPKPNRLQSKILVILHENTPQHRDKINAIRLAWKRATGHQSVLWSQQPIEVSF